jgi:vacuolar fusion protein MON1
MKADGCLDTLSVAIALGQTEYLVSELGIPGLRHFVYKSRSQVQITFPLFDEPYDSHQARRRFVVLLTL